MYYNTSTATPVPIAIRLICAYLSSTMNRRELLVAAAAATCSRIPAVVHLPFRSANQAGKGSVPLIHISDLYHPPQDPDDHYDLATIAALEEYDLRGVILDVTQKFLTASPGGFDIQRDPGFIPVVQLGYLLGRAIPVACGPKMPLKSSSDDLSDRPLVELAGVNLLLDLLKQSGQKVVISVVGSARVLTAAFNRDPGLLRSKTQTVLLNAGSSAGPKREWNVGLDPDAYIGLWKSGLPISWFPCATEAGAFNSDHERGVYWKTGQEVLLRSLAPPVRAWFAYALSRDPSGNHINLLDEPVDPEVWKHILADERNMWATASLVMSAGRVLAGTSQGWRFVRSDHLDGEDVWAWRLDRIHAEVDANTDVHWRLSEDGGNALLFGRERRAGFGTAMGEALAALLGSLGKA